MMLTEVNIQTVLKFSVVYCVKELYQLCRDWLEQHVSKENLFRMVELGLLVEKVGGEGYDVLDILAGFIRDDVKDELFGISKEWVISDGFVKFLIQQDILLYILPVLTAWVTKDADVVVVLDEFDAKDMTAQLYEHGELVLELFQKMSERIELLETSKMLHKSQTRYTRSITTNNSPSKMLHKSQTSYTMSITTDNSPSKMLHNSQTSYTMSETTNYSPKKIKNLQDLPANYRSFQLERMLGLEDEFNLNHVQFVEIVVEWIVSTEASQEVTNRLWEKIRQVELNKDYLSLVTSSITHYNTGLTLKPLDNISNYKYLLCEEIFEEAAALKTQEFSPECEQCKTQFTFKVKFVNSFPCYEVEASDPNHKIDHVYFRLYDRTKKYNLNRFKLSLLINNYLSIKSKVKECAVWKFGITGFWICCMYECTH